MKTCPLFFHHLNYLTAWISHPPSLCLLFLRPQSRHHCLLAAHLLTLSLPSVRWVRCRSSSPHQCRGWMIPHLHLRPLSPRLRLGPPTQRLHPGSQLPHLHHRPLAHQLHRAPSSLWLHLGRSLSRLRLRTPLLRLCLVAPSHRPCWAPPSLQLHLCPRLLLFCCGPPKLRLRLGRQSLGLRLDPPDPRSRPGLSALRLHLGLHLHLLCHHQSAPWSRQLFCPYLVLPVLILS
ncbi:Tyrosine-protein phosphatase Lar [Labeo rohita]|uniref:Tyrosine-protein phosphatase Lar n=1 Tax=Labeo rohita TaxID=84645 RepID=A0ABQ8M072_LABRO|nr:Tyrosine-protein phosphatase Lar [Labeo rohita]